MKAKVTLEIETPFTYVVSQDTVIQWFQDILQAAASHKFSTARKLMTKGMDEHADRLSDDAERIIEAQQTVTLDIL